MAVNTSYFKIIVLNIFNDDFQKLRCHLTFNHSNFELIVIKFLISNGIADIVI